MEKRNLNGAKKIGQGANPEPGMDLSPGGSLGGPDMNFLGQEFQEQDMHDNYAFMDLSEPSKEPEHLNNYPEPTRQP
jgi:hypothetical protein